MNEDLNSQNLIEKMETVVIPAHLRDVEREYDVKILFAVESGSRAWGFESKNSDWDVRFIYIHKPQWYFKVEEQRDVIEHMYPDDVDLVGWELRKALSLLTRSNPSLLEWFNSPKVYLVDEPFIRRIREVERQFFDPVKAMYHYNHIYNKNNERYLQQEGYPAKRFLYYLRGILACKWIENNKSLPPVPFKQLVDATVKDKAMVDKINELILMKKGERECDMMAVDNLLVEYARGMCEYYNDCVNSFRPEQKPARVETLDSILYDMVMNQKNVL